MKTGTFILSVMAVGGALLAGGCAGGGGTENEFADMTTAMPADSRVEEEGGERKVFHSVTAADEAYLKQRTPIQEGRATLYVNGMGCPQCVTNIDLKLEKSGHAEAVKVDLGSGLVYVKFPEGKHPSPAKLAELVNGDFTLVKIVPRG